jgi:hypothetical protein
MFCGPLERLRDFLRTGQLEDATLQIERVAFARHPLRPSHSAHLDQFEKPLQQGATSAISRGLLWPVTPIMG